MQEMQQQQQEVAVVQLHFMLEGQLGTHDLAVTCAASGIYNSMGSRSTTLHGTAGRLGLAAAAFYQCTVVL